MPLYHYSRLGDKTKNEIYQVISGLTFTYSHHAETQRIQKRVRDWEHIVENGTIIELNHDPITGRHKVLLRTPDGHCAVFGLKSKQIVTMWWNDPTDSHSTLRADHYDGGVNWNNL